MLDDLSTDKNIIVVEIDGSKIQSWHDYISIIQTEFGFPAPCYNNLDGYYDWMRDLDWLNKDGFRLVIHNFDKFMIDDSVGKHEVITGLSDIILPFWEDEVVQVVMDGKAKSFTVYLVD